MTTRMLLTVAMLIGAIFTWTMAIGQDASVTAARELGMDEVAGLFASEGNTLSETEAKAPQAQMAKEATLSDCQSILVDAILEQKLTNSESIELARNKKDGTCCVRFTVNTKDWKLDVHRARYVMCIRVTPISKTPLTPTSSPASQSQPATTCGATSDPSVDGLSHELAELLAASMPTTEAAEKLHRAIEKTNVAKKQTSRQHYEFAKTVASSIFKQWDRIEKVSFGSFIERSGGVVIGKPSATAVADFSRTDLAEAEKAQKNNEMQRAQDIWYSDQWWSSISWWSDGRSTVFVISLGNDRRTSMEKLQYGSDDYKNWFGKYKQF